MARNRKRAKDKRARRPQAVAYRTDREDPRGPLDEREDPRRLAEFEHGDALREREVRDPLAELAHDEGLGPGDEDETPGPMTHATPDVELVEVQLALGRSEFDRESEAAAEDGSEAEVADESETGLEDEYEPGPEDERSDTALAAEPAPRRDAAYEPELEDEYEPELQDESEAELDGEYEPELEDEAPDRGAGRRGRRASLGGETRRRGGHGALVATTGAVSERRVLPGNRLINFLRGSWRELQRVQWPDRRQVAQATGVVIGFVIVAGVFLGVADFLAGKLVNYILK